MQRLNGYARRALAAVIPVIVVLLVSGCGGEASGGAYPIDPTDELVATGRPIYVAQCAYCHGDATTRPPMLTAPPHGDDGHTWHHSDRQLVKWILDGVPGGHMPRFRGHLSEAEVHAVLAYIKTFWSEEVRQYQRRLSGGD
jgi:mono/diheme cytochrome c family protein